MDDLMKKVIEDYFGEPMPENVNLTCPTTLHDCIEIAKHYAAQQCVQRTGATCSAHGEPVSNLIHYACGCSQEPPRR